MRVLVIGHVINSPEAHSYDWNSLPHDLNPSEYEHVLIDKGQAEIDLSDGNTDLDLPHTTAFLDLLLSHKHLIYIGSHNRFRLTLGTGPDGFPKEVSLGPHCFFPCAPEVRELPSSTCNCHDTRFSRYLEHITKFSFYFCPDQPKLLLNLDFLSSYFGEQTDCFGIKPTEIATSNAGRPLAISYDIEFARELHKQGSFIRTFATEPSRKSVALMQTITWLPPCETNQRDAVLLLLEDLFGITEAPSRPEWCKNYITTNEKNAVRKIVKANNLIQKLRQKIDVFGESVDSEQEWKHLLYSTGAVLENAVYSALDYLQIDYSKPVKKGVEDGCIHDHNLGDWIIEIKGRSSQIKLHDIRQLKQWSDDNDIPGLLIENSFCNDAPFDRGNPLASNAKKLASESGLSVLSSFSIFQAVCKKQAGEECRNFLLNEIV